MSGPAPRGWTDEELSAAAAAITRRTRAEQGQPARVTLNWHTGEIAAASPPEADTPDR